MKKKFNELANDRFDETAIETAESCRSMIQSAHDKSNPAKSQEGLRFLLGDVFECMRANSFSFNSRIINSSLDKVARKNISKKLGLTSRINSISTDQRSNAADFLSRYFGGQIFFTAFLSCLEVGTGGRLISKHVSEDGLFEPMVNTLNGMLSMANLDPVHPMVVGSLLALSLVGAKYAIDAKMMKSSSNIEAERTNKKTFFKKAINSISSLKKEEVVISNGQFLRFRNLIENDPKLAIDFILNNNKEVYDFICSKSDVLQKRFLVDQHKSIEILCHMLCDVKGDTELLSAMLHSRKINEKWIDRFNIDRRTTIKWDSGNPSISH